MAAFEWRVVDIKDNPGRKRRGGGVIQECMEEMHGERSVSVRGERGSDIRGGSKRRVRYVSAGGAGEGDEAVFGVVDDCEGEA